MLDTLRNSLSIKAAELGGGPRRSVLFGSRADTSFRLTRLHANFFIHAIAMLTKPGWAPFTVLFFPPFYFDFQVIFLPFRTPNVRGLLEHLHGKTRD